MKAMSLATLDRPARWQFMRKKTARSKQLALYSIGFRTGRHRPRDQGKPGYIARFLHRSSFLKILLFDRIL